MEFSTISDLSLMPGPEVIAQRTKEQTVLFDMASGNYFALNELGARTWELMDGSRNLSEIATILATEYDAPVDVITDDIGILIDQLRADGLLADAKG